MRRFEALTDLGSYRFGKIYTFDKVPQVVLNAAQVGLMRELPPLRQGGIITSGSVWNRQVGEYVVPTIVPKAAPAKRGRRKVSRLEQLGEDVAQEIAQARGE